MGGRTPSTSLSCCRDADTIRIIELIRANEKITRAEIAKALGVGTATVSRRIKDMKGKMIDREGNNRSGRWIILPAYSDCTGSDSTITTEERSAQTKSADGAFESVTRLVAFVDDSFCDTHEQTVAVKGSGHNIRNRNASTSWADHFGRNNCRNDNKYFY